MFAYLMCLESRYQYYKAPEMTEFSDKLDCSIDYDKEEVIKSMNSNIDAVEGNLVLSSQINKYNKKPYVFKIIPTVHPLNDVAGQSYKYSAEEVQARINSLSVEDLLDSKILNIEPGAYALCVALFVHTPKELYSFNLSVVIPL